MIANRRRKLLTIGVGSLGLIAGATMVRAATSSITIQGTDAIFLAGRTDVTIAPPGNPPTGYPLLRSSPPGPYSETFPVGLAAIGGQTFQFSASGNVDLDVPLNIRNAVPDGAGFNTTVTPLAGISGYNGPEGAFVGVFLTDANPAGGTAPSTLNFSNTGGTSFTTLSPSLDQLFFIGDGLTGTGSGTTQSFVSPSGIRLFLGVVDVNASGAPGNYDDNSGAFSVAVTTSAVPEPGSVSLLCIGAIAMLKRRIGRSRSNAGAA